MILIILAMVCVVVVMLVVVVHQFAVGGETPNEQRAACSAALSASSVSVPWSYLSNSRSQARAGKNRAGCFLRGEESASSNEKTDETRNVLCGSVITVQIKSKQMLGRGSNYLGRGSNFTGLVLGCIEAKVFKYNLVSEAS